MLQIFKAGQSLSIAALVLAISGCAGSGSSAIGPQVNLPAPMGQYQALAFNLTTDKSVYAVGEPVTATFTVTNTGSQPLAFNPQTLNNASMLVELGSAEIWDADLHTTSTGFGTPPADSLAPGQSIAYTFIWNQVSDDGQESRPGTPLPQLPGGTYTIRGYALENFYGKSTQPESWYQTNFAAPLVTITIQ